MNSRDRYNAWLQELVLAGAATLILTSFCLLLDIMPELVLALALLPGGLCLGSLFAWLMVKVPKWVTRVACGVVAFLIVPQMVDYQVWKAFFWSFAFACACLSFDDGNAFTAEIKPQEDWPSAWFR